MLKKLLVLALTSGLAAKLYKSYANKNAAGNPSSRRPDSASANPPKQA